MYANSRRLYVGEARANGGGEMLTITIQVNAPPLMVEEVKEHLAMCLEKYGDTRVIDIKESWPKKTYKREGT